MMQRTRSLSVRLFWQLSGLIAIAVVAMIGVVAIVMFTEVSRAADRSLMVASRALYVLMHEEVEATKRDPAYMESGRPLLSKEDIQAFHTIADSQDFAILRNGQIVFKSANFIADEDVLSGYGFRNFDIDGREWRSYASAFPEFNLGIFVTEPLSVRNEVVGETLARLILPLLALFAGVAVVLWIALRSGLQDLRKLRETLASRSHSDLGTLDPTPWARELHGLIGALNSLFGRLDRAFERERLFTATAAHQLRTPIATIRLQAQILQRTAPVDLHQDIRELIAGIDRANTSVEQMLQLARLEETALSMQDVDLKTLIGQVIAEHLLMASQVDMEVSLDVATDAVSVHTDPRVLSLALNNLVENAVRHASKGGEIQVLTQATDNDIRVHVLDRGDGIPEQARARASELFATLSSTSSGSGLGLAVVQRSVALLGGRLLLDDRPGGRGLAATISLPRRR